MCRGVRGIRSVDRYINEEAEQPTNSKRQLCGNKNIVKSGALLISLVELVFPSSWQSLQDQVHGPRFSDPAFVHEIHGDVSDGGSNSFRIKCTACSPDAESQLLTRGSHSCQDNYYRREQNIVCLSCIKKRRYHVNHARPAPTACYVKA